MLRRLIWVLFLAGVSIVAGNNLPQTGESTVHRTSSDTGLSRRTAGSHCDPFVMDFDSSTSTADFKNYFDSLGPPNSYELGSDGLKLFLDRPDGKITTKGDVNDKVAEGATFNGTHAIRYGKVTYKFSGPAVPGVVSAAILIGTAAQRDEIDVELVGGDPAHWQTNVFAPAPRESEPLYTAFSSVEEFTHYPKSVSSRHAYTIDWSPERIVWSLDGSEVRTLRKDDTMKNGNLHYPSHPSILQFGIWDASSPAGTSEWARGPIDWKQAPKRMSAVFEGIQVECPY